MSIGPTTPPGPRIARVESARTARSSSNSGSSSDSVRLQHEASDQAAAVQGQINQINLEGQQNEDRLKEGYNEEYQAEGVRAEEAIEGEKSKGYERLRALQKQNQMEERHVQRQGEEDVAGLKERFKNETARTQNDGNRELTTLQKRYLQQQEFEHARGESEIQNLQKDNTLRTTQIHDTNEAKLTKLAEDYRKQYEDKRASTEAATEQSTKKIDAQHTKIMAEHFQAANRVAHESNRQIEAVRADTAKKLAAYQERQHDPFYKMITLGAEVREEADKYVVYANVPEFEQPNVKIAMSGGKLIISGQRRNEEKLDLGPGRTQATSSFQSFSESFPILAPVDANNIVREAKGDTLKITLPKKVVAFTEPVKSAHEVRRAAVEKPHFPQNLPHVAHEDEPAPRVDSAEAKPDEKSDGSGTLGVS